MDNSNTLSNEKHNHFSLRQSHKLSLRKEKIKHKTIASHVYNNNSNTNLLNATSYEINIQNLNLPNDIVSTYNSLTSKAEKLQSISSLLSSQDIPTLYFAMSELLCILKATTHKDTSIILEALPQSKVDLLCEFICTPKQDTKIIFTIANIFVILTYISDTYSSIILNKATNLYEILTTISDNHFLIKKHIIWLFTHLISSSIQNANHLLHQCPSLPMFIYTLIENSDNVYSNNNTSNVYEKIDLAGMAIWLYGEFFKLKTFEIDIINHKCFIHMPIIAKIMASRIQVGNFSECVETVKSFLTSITSEDNIPLVKEEHYDLIHKMKLESLSTFLVDKHSKLIDYLDTKENILSILVKLTSFSDIAIDNLVTNYSFINTIEEIFQQLLSSNSKIPSESYMINLLYIIYNLIVSESGDVIDGLLRNSKVCSYLIQLVLKNKLGKYKGEIIDIFDLLLNENDIRTTTELIVIGIPEVLVQYLNDININDIDFITKVLHCLNVCLLYDKEIGGNVRYVGNHFEKMGIRDKLDKLISLLSSKHNDVSELAISINKTFFS